MDKPFLPEPSDNTQRIIDIILRVTLLMGLLVWCMLILAPFLSIVVWGIIIAITVSPAHARLTRKLKGRSAWSAAVFSLLGLVLIALPGYLLTESLLKGIHYLREMLGEGPIHIPPPPENVREWPVIGNTVFNIWSNGTHGLRDVFTKFGPQIAAGGKWLFSALGRFGMDILQFVASIIVAGILLANSSTGSKMATAFFVRLAGEKGDEFAGVAEVTIRNVSVGIIGVALIQTILVTLGFVVAGVPGAAVLAIFCLMLSIIQVGMFPVILPVIIYMFATAEPMTAILLTIWLLLVGLVDNVLKPIFLGRGAPVPMPVVFLGAIGGFILSGLIGLFIGAVVLSLGYRLFRSWLVSALPQEEAEEAM